MTEQVRKIAIACQGGGTHGAFEVGVLSRLLEHMQNDDSLELVGLSGTSAGALCAMMVWYGLAPIKGHPGRGSIAAAIDKINSFWDGFAAVTPTEVLHNAMCRWALSAQEQEVPVLGINMPIFGINPHGTLDEAILWQLRQLGAREEYYDFSAMLNAACPEFDDIDWARVKTRLLLGASEILDGVETVFDSDCNRPVDADKHTAPSLQPHRWRRRVRLSLQGVAASGTLPGVREAEKIDGGYYWDGLYSQNPPVREFLSGIKRAHVPDEIWVIRINPQQAARVPQSHAEVRDRENELMGNLSLNKELDFILVVNDMIRRFPDVAAEYKPVTVRTIKMRAETAATLRTSSKFDRSHSFIDKLRAEGRQVADGWLQQWLGDVALPQPDPDRRYPNDAAYDLDRSPDPTVPVSRTEAAAVRQAAPAELAAG